MALPFTLVVAALGLALLGTGAGRSADADADASLVTAIDVSDSVAAADIRAQRAALAAAFRSPDFLAAIRRGRTGRVRVAVFLWHHYQFEVLPWTVIGSPSEADAAARAIEAAVPVNIDLRPAGARFLGRLTDLSRALDHAAELLDDGHTGRAVVNVIGNGADNMGEPAAPARDRLLATGATINGVALGGDPGVADYYRGNVAGGAGSFVIATTATDTLIEVMHRKLLLDLVAALGG